MIELAWRETKKQRKGKKESKKLKRKKRKLTEGVPKAGRTYIPIATPKFPPRIFITSGEVDGDPEKKAKLRRYYHVLVITPTPKDDNNLVDKHFSDTYHMKSIYFDDEDEDLESFKLNQDGYYTKGIEKLNDTEESMTINQNLEQIYDQYVTEYSIIQ